MADQFPSWWSASAKSDPQLFNTPDEVPPGWVHRVGMYDHEIGQFVTAEQAEARAAEKRKAQQDLEKAEAADNGPAEPIQGDEPAPARKRRGNKWKGTNMSNEPKAVNEDEEGIRKPQPDETPSDVNDPGNVAKERDSDGVVRTGNRPTRR